MVLMSGMVPVVQKNVRKSLQHTYSNGQNQRDLSRLGMRGQIDRQLSGLRQDPECDANYGPRALLCMPQLKSIGYLWSYVACRIGRLIPIWQPIIGSPFHFNVKESGDPVHLIMRHLGSH
jgi:hypothetical protein